MGRMWAKILIWATFAYSVTIALETRKIPQLLPSYSLWMQRWCHQMVAQ